MSENTHFFGEEIHSLEKEKQFLNHAETSMDNELFELKKELSVIEKLEGMVKSIKADLEKLEHFKTEYNNDPKTKNAMQTLLDLRMPVERKITAFGHFLQTYSDEYNRFVHNRAENELETHKVFQKAADEYVKLHEIIKEHDHWFVSTFSNPESKQ